MTNKEKQALILTMFDLNQSEGFLLEKGQHSALIDCGTQAQGKNIVNYLKDRKIEKIDYVFITHPHEDHMGGLLNIIKNFQVGKIILPNIDLKKITASWYKNLMKELNNGCHQLEFAQKDKTVNLDDVEIKIISDSTYNGNNINNYSMVLKITYGQHSIIMTGDAEENVEKEILKENNNLKATILKVGHHGSNTATTAEFIEAINPTYALISCGENNRYKHPSQEVLERLNKYEIQTFRTDKHGDVVLKIEQDKIEVLVEK